MFDMEKFQKEGEYMVVTLDDWFIAKDGQMYKAVWGKCKVVEAKDILGFKPASPSTNWYLSIGEGDNALFIAGCRIHYAQICILAPQINNILKMEEN